MGWWVGGLVGCLVGWWVGCLVGWWVGWWVGCLDLNLQKVEIVKFAAGDCCFTPNASVSISNCELDVMFKKTQLSWCLLLS